MPSTLPVPLRSLSFRTLDLWWSAGSEDRQRCQLSTSPWSILGKPGTSKWSSHHPCQEPWWTAWLSRWEEYSVSVHQRVVVDVPFFTRHQFIPQRPVLLGVMLSTVPTIPYAQKTWFYDFKLIPFRHNHPELLDLNTSCHWNNHFQSKQLFDMAFYPPPTSSKMLHTCVHVNKNVKKQHVAIAQKLDLVEQNQCDFWVQHIRFVLNQLKKRRQQICCWPV